MKSLLLKFLPHIAVGTLVVILSLIIYILVLKSDNKDLTKENTELNKTVAAHVLQVEALTTRETEYKLIEADYEKIRKELKGKSNGPVADVLRHAVGVR